MQYTDTPLKKENKKRIKRDLELDALGYLYRSSYYMALGNRDLSLKLFKKASENLISLKKIKIFLDKKNNLLAAERILDFYNQMKISSN